MGNDEDLQELKKIYRKRHGDDVEEFLLGRFKQMHEQWDGDSLIHFRDFF